MSLKRINQKADEFIADILKNFCYVHRILKTTFQDYHDSTDISFFSLADILGSEMNQGRLWRLKDKAHLLFRMRPDPPLSEKFLDWSLSYIFHECMKLKEDAYQQQTYAPWFQQVRLDWNLNSLQRQKAENFFQLTAQTRESIDREIQRISFIMENCLDIFIDYLPVHKDNSLLARFIYDHQALVQSVFQTKYQSLIQSIYKNRPEKMYCLAATSFRQGGWHNKALRAIDLALEINPKNEKVKQEKKIIDNLFKKR